MIKNMTAEELIHYLNTTYGINSWPETLNVDTSTYGNCCQHTFNYLLNKGNFDTDLRVNWIRLVLGNKDGLMFKGVELILTREEVEPRTAAGSLD